MPKICLTLKSDLCPANGEGFSSVIDTDICADEYGLPFIPSRRLKGCLREAAEEIGCDRIAEIFGENGASVGGSLKFSSPARLSDYGEAISQVQGAPREEVTRLFAYTRAATEIDRETESAKENSLRFMRVIKQYIPCGKDEYRPLVFEAECELDERYNAEMTKICKALRNIGYKRNRGFGAVACEYKPGNAITATAIPDLSGLADEDEYALPYTLVNEVPLVISTINNDETMDYIPGGMILGAIAWSHPNKGSEDFADLFLRDNICFSNCYPGTMPAPSCWAKYKKSGGYINTAVDTEREDDTPKPLKDKYLTVINEKTARVSEVKREVIYHHSVAGKMLYTQTSLCEGQGFQGQITGKGKYLKRLAPFLPTGHISVGKSKTAQYAYCRIVYRDVAPIEPKTVHAQEIAVVLKSDVLLLNEGAYTDDYGKLATAMSEKGICGNFDSKKSALSYRVVSGYSGVWNLKKPQMKAFKAGSVLIFGDVGGDVPAQFRIGARQGEGFGECIVYDLQGMGELQKSSGITESAVGKEGIYADLLKGEAKQLEIKADAIAWAGENPFKKDIITMSQIGRLRLMLAEAINKDDFHKRIDSIKAEAVKGEAAKRFRARDFDDFNDYKLFWDTVLQVNRMDRKIEEKGRRRDEK
ncbi:MAG: hypothetical protein LBI54_10750 [Lachnospiraceae bacterium]|jgi:hypothetical protein|nr:hypothetical protein [Lachnospiraceae bacterium]